MAITKAYLTSTKSLADIFDAIKSAQAPERFSIRFLEQLGFKSKYDRLVINVLKGLGFLTDTGTPTQRYYEFLDQTQSEVVLAIGIREAYEDLFRINKEAQGLSAAEVSGKLKTLLEGKKSESVISKMTLTFSALCELADFQTDPESVSLEDESSVDEKDAEDEGQEEGDTAHTKERSGISKLGLSYDIHLHLPASRDPAVYEVLFRSLREHLL